MVEEQADKALRWLGGGSTLLGIWLAASWLYVGNDRRLFWGIAAFGLSAGLAWTVRNRLGAGQLWGMLAGTLLLAGWFWGQAARAAHWVEPTLAGPLLQTLSAAALPWLLASIGAAQACRPPGWNTRRLGADELHVLVLLSYVAVLLLPGNAAAWETGGRAQDPFWGVVGAPAAWSAPVLAIGIGLGLGLLALQLLRRPGVAAMLFAAAHFVQAIANFWVVQPAVSPEGGGTDSGVRVAGIAGFFLAMLAAFVLDAAYRLRLTAADERPTLWYAIGSSLLLVLASASILLPRTAASPALSPAAALLVGVGGGLLGLWCGWWGAAAGRALADRALQAGSTAERQSGDG
ncbi:MAG: hypothetical protein NTV69_10455 [Caldilinea sp.]|nr:hypothetical protein [Caldilinea sp.]